MAPHVELYYTMQRLYHLTSGKVIEMSATNQSHNNDRTVESSSC